MKAASAGGNAAGAHSAHPPEQAAAGPGPSPQAGVVEVDLEHSPEGPPAEQPQAFVGTSADLYPEQQMRCPVHLCIGQEAPPVGVCSQLEPCDYAFSTIVPSTTLVRPDIGKECLG